MSWSEEEEGDEEELEGERRSALFAA